MLGGMLGPYCLHITAGVFRWFLAWDAGGFRSLQVPPSNQNPDGSDRTQRALSAILGSLVAFMYGHREL